MSTDWSEHATPEECRRRAGEPGNHGVVGLSVGGVRACEGLSVDHTPQPDHYSHTDIGGIPDGGPDLVQVRSQLFKMVRPDRWAIHPDEPWEGAA